VPGLRKEELAVLAGISADHYSRLEQGRQTTLSEDMCAALARALRLDELESKHLRALAGRAPHRAGWESPQRPEPGLLRVMTALGDLPAILLGRRSEVLASNALLGPVLGTAFAPGTQFVRWLLLEPAARDRIANWDDFARAAVGGLRYELGRHPGDHKLSGLIGELCAQSAEIARWWDEQGVVDRTSLTKRVIHPEIGPLEFGIEAVTTPHQPDQRLVIYTVEPGSLTARNLPLLRGWAQSVPEFSTERPSHVRPPKETVVLSVGYE
jgi:transcriptional regulator with XRE-family HTH domain